MKSGCMTSSSFADRVNTRTSSAWWRTSCAPGGRSGFGATNSVPDPPYRTDRRRSVRQLRRQCRVRVPPSARLATAGARARSQSGVPEFDQRPLDAGRQGTARRPALLIRLDAIGTKQKDAMRERIMRGWPFTPEERQQILELLRQRRRCAATLAAADHGQPEFDLGVALYHGEFAAASASDGASRRADRHGGVCATRRREDTWRAVRDAMVPAIDAQYGVYVRNAAGDWTFNMRALRRLSQRARASSGRCSTPASSTCSARPSRPWPRAGHSLEDLRQLRHARDKMRKIKLACRRRRTESHGAVAVQV